MYVWIPSPAVNAAAVPVERFLAAALNCSKLGRRKNMADDGDSRTCTAKIMDSMFEYQTLKIVNIGNKKIGLLNRMIQGGILAYIIG